jgi:hypothetical protein
LFYKYTDKYLKSRKGEKVQFLTGLFDYLSLISTQICLTLPLDLEIGTLTPIDIINTFPFNPERSKLSQ